MESILISDFDLDEGEKVVQESATVCNVEFDKREEFFEHAIGMKEDARVVSRP